MLDKVEPAALSEDEATALVQKMVALAGGPVAFAQMLRDRPPTLTQDQARARLVREVRRRGGVTAFARHFGISAGYVSQACRGDETIGPGLQGAIGVSDARMYFITVAEKGS